MSRFALLGHPVAHSISPEIHLAAYRALGLSHSYELVDCADAAAFERALSELRQGEIAGANVTLPYKRLALELADSADAWARETRAANVLAPRGRELSAHNTDVAALAEELALFAPGATSAVILGGGGAARAAVAACRARGVREVSVVVRRAAELERAFREQGAETLSWPADPHTASELADAISAADVVIQATSASMTGGEPGQAVAAAVPWERVPASALAYDVVYTPRVTPFLKAAHDRGLSARGGLGMLVGQAAAAIRIWLELEPPLTEMRLAAETALAAREER